MPSSEYEVPGFPWNVLRSTLAALLLAVAMVGIAAPGTKAQGLDHLTNSYVTPFPEQNRYRLYVFGDSLGDGIWAGLYRAFNPDGNIDIVKKSRVSTGFVRTDYFDWNRNLAGILTAEKVHIAVIMVGANDMQPIRGSGKWNKVGSDGWGEM